MAPKAKPKGKSSFRKQKKSQAKIPFLKDDLGASSLTDMPHFHAGAACLVEQPSGAWAECELYGEESGALIIRYVRSGCLEPLAGRRLCEQPPLILPGVPTVGDAVLVGAGGQVGGEWWQGVVLDAAGDKWRVAYGRAGDDFVWTSEEGADSNKAQVKIFYSEEGSVQTSTVTLSVRKSRIKYAKRQELRQGLHWLPVEGDSATSLTASASVFTGPFIQNTSYAGCACSPGAAWFASTLPFDQTEPKRSLAPEEFQRWSSAAGLDGKEAFAVPVESVKCLAIGEAALVGSLPVEEQQLALFRLMVLCACRPPPGPDTGGLDAYIVDYTPMVAEILSDKSTRALIASGETRDLVAQLAEIMTNHIRRTPQLFAAASRAIERAVATSPELMESVYKLWQNASEAVMTALESDEAAKAWMVATQVASQAAAVCRLAIERGAPIARQSINTVVGFLGDARNLKEATDVDAIATASKVLAEVQQYVPQAQLERFGQALSKGAETMGEGFAGMANLANSMLPEAVSSGGNSASEEAFKFLSTALQVAERDGERITKDASEEFLNAVQAGGQLSAEVASKSKTLIQEVVRSAPPQLVAALHKASAAAASIDGAEVFGAVKGFVVEQLSVASNAAVYLASLNVRLSVPLEDMQQVATGTLVNLLQQAKQKGANISQGMLDAAQRAMESGKPMAEDVLKNAQKGLSSAIAALDDLEVADAQRALSAAGKACGGVYSKLSDVNDKAVEDAIAAGRQLAPLAGKLVEPGVGHCAALAAGALLAARDAADAGLPEEWRAAAATAAAELKAAADEACTVVGPAAASVTAYITKIDYAGTANQIAGAVYNGAAAAADVVLPVLGDGASALKGVWDDVDLDDAYTMSADAVQDAVGTLVSGCGCLGNFDLLNFEIIRDFYQMVALFFSNVKTKSYQGLVKIWGYIGFVFAFDITFAFPKFPIIYALFALGGVALLSFFISMFCIYKAFSMMPDKIADGLESKGWTELSETNPHTLRAIKYNLVVLLCIHLPVSRMAMQIMACRPDDADINALKKILKFKECPESWLAWGGIALIVVGLGIPVVIYRIISLNKPAGSPKHDGMVFDKDGITLIDFTDEIYNDRIANDLEQTSSPFVDLYRGFERRWAYFKIFMMLLKLGLAGVIVACAGKTAQQTTASFGCILIYTAITGYSTPYIDPSYDKTELSGKIANMANLVFGFFDHKAARLGVVIVMTLQTFVLMYYTLMGFQCSKNKIKSCIQMFDFTDTCLNRGGTAEDIIPNWKLDREVQHRIWWPFWDGILLNCYSEDTSRRFLQLKRITENEGRFAIEEHFAAMADATSMAGRRYAIEELEGVDVFWDGEAFDGSNNSTSKLGKMYIKRYPFECVMVWDQGEGHCFLQGREQINALVAANQRPEIQAIRQNRWELRALNGCLCHYEMSRTESRTVEDGVEEYTDSDGKRQTRKRYSTIQVQMYYHNGTLCIYANSEKRMAAGFEISFSYTDGHGEGVAPFTGETRSFTGECCTLDIGELQFPANFQRSDGLATFLNDPDNSAAAQARVPNVHNDRLRYRQEMQALDDEDEKCLPHSFWYKVYTKETATREEIEEYFSTCPGEFQKLPIRHAKGFDYVFARIAFVLKSKRHALWYCFFDDLWNTNKGMSCMQDPAVQKELDPRVSTSICYSMMEKDLLDSKLRSLGLRKAKKLFSDALLDLLFDKLANVESVGSGQGQVSPSTIGYSRFFD